MQRSEIIESLTDRGQAAVCRGYRLTPQDRRRKRWSAEADGYAELVRMMRVIHFQKPAVRRRLSRTN